MTELVQTSDGIEFERGQVHGIYWPLLLAAALLAILVPWLLGTVQTDLRPALKVLLSGGLAAVALILVWPRNAHWLIRSTPYLIGVILLDALWYQLGNFDAPYFLILFSIPVFSAALDSNGWLEYSMAAFAVAATSITASIASPVLRWYVDRLWPFPGWLSWLPPATAGSAGGYSSFDGYTELVALGNFAIAIFAIAFLGNAATLTIVRAERGLDESKRSLRRSEALATALVEDRQTPEAFINSKSGVITSANRAFGEYFRIDIDGRQSILDVVGPSYGDEFDRFIRSQGEGALTHQLCIFAGRSEFLDFELQPFTAEEVTNLKIRPTPGISIVQRAIDSIGIGLAVIGPDQRLLFSNLAFMRLFPKSELAVPTSIALSRRYGLPEAWWDIAPRKRAHLRFEASGTDHLAELFVTDGPPSHVLTIITTKPVADNE